MSISQARTLDKIDEIGIGAELRKRMLKRYLLQKIIFVYSRADEEQRAKLFQLFWPYIKKNVARASWDEQTHRVTLNASKSFSFSFLGLSIINGKNSDKIEFTHESIRPPKELDFRNKVMSQYFGSTLPIDGVWFVDEDNNVVVLVSNITLKEILYAQELDKARNLDWEEIDQLMYDGEIEMAIAKAHLFVIERCRHGKFPTMFGQGLALGFFVS